LKTEIEDKGLGENYPFGFPMYAVGQCADILIFRPELVPVGEDQVAHIEPCREVARRFNQLYCGVDPHAEDSEHESLGGVFPIPRAEVGRIGRLPGVDGRKMSKSLNNAIFLSDSAKKIKKKVGQIFTGRQTMDEPGNTSNLLFDYVRAFITDRDRVAELEKQYAAGDNIGDGHIKAEVAEAIDAIIAPKRERRTDFDTPAGEEKILRIIRDGTRRANEIAEATLHEAKRAMKLDFGVRELRLGS
ncbi:MAG: tryptophan--tRNA ligase, partial [Planctomycetota bacterium]